MNQLQRLGLVTGVLVMLGIQPGWAETVVKDWKSEGVKEPRGEEVKPLHPITSSPLHPITRLRDLKRPATTVKDWMAQVEAATVQVTNVRVEQTDSGLDITLETAAGKPLQVDATKFRSEGNSLIADIPNAVLALPNAQEFSAENPIEDIATVRVTQVDANTIRVTVAGNGALPKQEVSLKTGAFAYTLNPEGETPEEEIVVTGERNGYSVPDTTTATRTDTPLRDVPQSVQVIPQQVLRDQQATTIQEALRNVSGASLGDLPGFQQNTFVLRGFTGNYLRNGLPDFNAAYATDLANVERLDVLKGPASVLFGVGTPGATINLITKKPLTDPFYAVDATVGNYDTYRGAIDLSGPLNDSKTVLYRLNAVYQDTGSFVDFLSTRNYSIAPVISLMLGTRTKLTIEGEYKNSRVDGFTLGLPAVGTVLPNPNGKIPINRNTSEPNYYTEARVGSISYDLEHQFSNNWSLRNAFQATFASFDSLRGSSNDLLDDNRTVDRNYFTEEGDQYSYALITNLIGKISTGSIQHQLLFGVDLNRSGYPVYKSFFGTAALLDLYNPVYGQPPREPLNSRNRLSSLTDSLGVYLQDQVNIAENLKLLLGGRFDLFTQTNGGLNDGELFQELSQGGDAFSPRVGIVYQPIPAISLYGSYTRSFTPNFGRSRDNRLFDPERGRQYEVGVKADLSSRLSTTLAFYDLERSNVLTADPNDDSFSILTGEQRSRGIELNIDGEILPGWNIYAGYAYTDARITKDNTYRVGSRLFATPQNAVSLWTTYELQRGGLKGFGVGLGLFYVGEREGDLENDFQLPDYLRTDASLFYKLNQLRVQLNIRNLFNINYFETTGGQITKVVLGSPLTVEGRISWEF